MVSDRWEWLAFWIMIVSFAFIFWQAEWFMEWQQPYPMGVTHDMHFGVPSEEDNLWARWKVSLIPNGYDIVLVAPEAREKLMKCMEEDQDAR